MYSMALVCSSIGLNTPGMPRRATAPPTQHTARRHQEPAPAIGEARQPVAKGTNHWPANLRSFSVGVRRIFCSAGKSVKTIIQVKTSPTATHRPISRIGRISDTDSAAKPTAVAKIEAVAGDELVGQREDLMLVDGALGAVASTKRECK